MLVGRQRCDRKAADDDLLIVSWMCRVGRGAVGQLAREERHWGRQKIDAYEGRAEGEVVSNG